MLVGSIFVEMMVNFLVVHITKSEFLAHQRVVRQFIIAT
jgi:hypothetical protein